ncbi:hypothetical protein [Burkholderia sp. Leaf177]|uniref:hypothetical protein n=1 Tax=Burkholderia sp. Leaf177 TaxID=1736287 RepID=UPI0012E360DB|nr:hypothetical protein [Burkholderia sp. Leaf177]
MLATDMFAARGDIIVSNSLAILLDTHVGVTKNYDAAKELGMNERSTKRLPIAMSSFAPEEPVEALRSAWYDGHSRRPCPMWQIADLPDSFFQTES